MAESYPTLQRHSVYNPYPRCVFLQLITKTSDISPEELILDLNYNFNEQEKSLLNGQIKFGFKGGKLNLKVQEAIITEPQLNGNFPFQLIEHNSNCAVWELVPQTGKAVIKLEHNAPLGKITNIAPSTSIIVSYTVSLKDISITDVTGLWRHDIHPNKHSILERKLAQFLWKERLSPEVSVIELNTKDLGEEKNIDHPKTDIEPQHLAQLHQLIDKIYEAKTNNVLELSNIAELNTKQDLAGGNFLAGELSGIELSGANLTQTNFRGANLTDADLSETTLSYARFSGADLSGVYLGNSNLQQADFYRSSLALANLIGADLRGANLNDVNLSQTNLSGANVTGAKFGNNEGMTPEIKASLESRGAIFAEN